MIAQDATSDMPPEVTPYVRSLLDAHRSLVLERAAQSGRDLVTDVREMLAGPLVAEIELDGRRVRVVRDLDPGHVQATVVWSDGEDGLTREDRDRAVVLADTSILHEIRVRVTGAVERIAADLTTGA